MMLATIPPISNQMALSVGEPVKKRDTLEPKELLALMPNTIRRIPIASNAIETGLFMANTLERPPKSSYRVKPEKMALK
jgi:hypothetical protein